MIVDTKLTVQFQELSKRDWQKVERALTFVTDGGEVVTSFIRLPHKGICIMPRGAWSVMPNNISYFDKRVCPPMPKLKFTVKLDDVSRDKRFAGQMDAVNSMFEQEQGIIVRPPGTGKTQIALYFAAKCKTRTLVITHTEDILQQWLEYAAAALSEAEIGVVRGKTVEVGHITIATIQTLQRFKRKPEFFEQFGCVIVDEAHHVAAASWEAILNVIPARYRFGFTASPTRADSMHPAMRHIIGPIIHRQKFTSPVKLTVVPVRTNFKTLYRGSWDWTRMVTALVQDPERNAKIARMVDAQIEKGNSVLVLSRRIEHLERIAGLMRNDAEILTGSRSRGSRRETLTNFRNGSVHCVLATQLADEALDVPRLNRVFLIHPGKHEGRIIQQVGRAIRMHESKTNAVIFDFVDWKMRVLRRQWNQRKHTYHVNKINVKKRKISRRLRASED